MGNRWSGQVNKQMATQGMLSAEVCLRPEGFMRIVKSDGSIEEGQMIGDLKVGYFRTIHANGSARIEIYSSRGKKHGS